MAPKAFSALEKVFLLHSSMAELPHQPTDTSRAPTGGPELKLHVSGNTSLSEIRLFVITACHVKKKKYPIETV